MKEGEKAMEFTIDNLETLSIKNNWCSWCVNVFVSDQTGEWNSCGTGLLSFYGKKKQQSSLSKLASIKELKNDTDLWEPSMFTMQVRSNKNLASNNKDLKVDPDLKKKLTKNSTEDLILHVELSKSSQCALSDLVIMWYQDDIGEHLAISFLSAVAIIESWEIICRITGCELQDTFKIQVDYLDYILNSLLNKDEDLIKKKLIVAVFCSKLDSMKELVKIYKDLNRQDPAHQVIASKVHKIAMLLLEEWQLDILLHVLHEEVFYDMLDILKDMHAEKTSTVDYKEFFINQTHFHNYYNFPPHMVDIIKMRYKIMFLKDYIFCDHQKEEFLNYLNSIIEIPSSSIFLFLTENNKVFLHLIERLDDASDQFFNEFFAIYKPLSNDSKALFAVTFFMKNLHSAYILKSYLFLKERAENRHKILNMVEMLGLLLTSKKENAVKMFSTKVEHGEERVTFSMVLNLMIADPLEKIKDCASNIISMMTETVLNDRLSHISLLNSYLIPGMAEYIQKMPTEDLTWKYYHSYIRLLTLCIDKETSQTANNSYLTTNLVNYKILASLPPVFEKYKQFRVFVVNFVQFVAAVLAISDEVVVSQVIENGYLWIVWRCLTSSMKRNNLLFSICMKVVADIEKTKVPQYLAYFAETFGQEIKDKAMESNPVIRKLMERYRALNEDPNQPRDVDGEFSDASGQAGSSMDEELKQKPPEGNHRDFPIISTINEKVNKGMDEILQDVDKENDSLGTTSLATNNTQNSADDLRADDDQLLGKRQQSLD